MKIQLNTDKNIEGTEKLANFVSEELEDSLKRFENKITRIEVHLSDQNADKGGADDIQCKIEARLEGVQPVMVTSKSDSVHKALDEAVKKIKATLEARIGKMRNR